MRRLLASVLGCLLVASACSLPLTEDLARDAEDTSTPTTAPTTPSTERALPPPPTLPPLDSEIIDVLTEIPGRLAVGLGGFVGLVNPNGTSATIIGGGDGAIASQPTWSTEGALLAWSEFRIGKAAIVVFDPDSGAEIRSSLIGSPAFYLQWNHADQVVSFLRNDLGGSGLEAGVVRPGSEPTTYDVGAPYFFQWSPDRDIWVAHANDERVSIVSSNQIVDVGDSLRPFSTPMWLDGDRVLIANLDGFVIVDLTDGEAQTLPVTEGALQFVASPDGSKVAFLEPLPPIGGQTQVGPLRVLDLESGEMATVTDQRAVAWEWSPDSSRLAWMGLDRADAANLANWHFWQVADAVQLSATPSFRPSDTVLSSYLPFFTQYSVSHTAWAPDSSAFAFAGAINGDAGIWVHAIDGGVDAARISTGDVVFWSPDDEPLAGSEAVAPF